MRMNEWLDIAHTNYTQHNVSFHNFPLFQCQPIDKVRHRSSYQIQRIFIKVNWGYIKVYNMKNAYSSLDFFFKTLLMLNLSA